jgi:hypothetical protein
VDYYVHCCLDACPLGQVQALVILDPRIEALPPQLDPFLEM